MGDLGAVLGVVLGVVLGRPEARFFFFFEGNIATGRALTSY